MRRVRNRKTSESFALDKNGLVVSAKDMSLYCELNKLNPHKLTFRCLGKNRCGESCSCVLTLCSCREDNMINPYFARRLKSQGHIADCDALKDYRTVRLIRRADMSFGASDPKEILNCSSSKCIRSDRRNNNEEKTEKNFEEEMMKALSNFESATEIDYVPITSALDYYHVLTAASSHNFLMKTPT